MRYRVEELTEEEQQALVSEETYQHQMSCQSDGVSQGESDLSLRRDGNEEDLHEEEVE
jgi:hypothetical protein